MAEEFLIYLDAKVFLVQGILEHNFREANQHFGGLRGYQYTEQ